VVARQDRLLKQQLLDVVRQIGPAWDHGGTDNMPDPVLGLFIHDGLAHATFPCALTTSTILPCRGGAIELAYRSDTARGTISPHGKTKNTFPRSKLFFLEPLEFFQRWPLG
jgi:hypothetical protein